MTPGAPENKEDSEDERFFRPQGLWKPLHFPD